MKKFFCNGKGGICDCAILCVDCSFASNTGGHYVEDKPTYGDRIRKMSDEELAEWALYKAPEIGREYTDSLKGLIKRLKTPIQEDEHG